MHYKKHKRRREHKNVSKEKSWKKNRTYDKRHQRQATLLKYIRWLRCTLWSIMFSSIIDSLVRPFSVRWFPCSKMHSSHSKNAKRARQTRTTKRKKRGNRKDLISKTMENKRNYKTLCVCEFIAYKKYRTQKYKRAKRNESHLWLFRSFFLFVFFFGLCGIEWIEDRALQIYIYIYIACVVAQVSKLLAASIMKSALSHKHTKYISCMHNNCWKRIFFFFLFFFSILLHLCAFSWWWFFQSKNRGFKEWKTTKKKYAMKSEQWDSQYASVCIFKYYTYVRLLNMCLTPSSFHPRVFDLFSLTKHSETFFCCSKQ